VTDRSNSPVSTGALEELTRGIEEKARDTDPEFHVVTLSPGDPSLEPEENETEFRKEENLDAWIEKQPDHDVIVVIRYEEE
jgi:hypothetical protein